MPRWGGDDSDVLRASRRHCTGAADGRGWTLTAPGGRPSGVGNALLSEIAQVAASAREVEVLESWVEPEGVFCLLFSSDTHVAWLDAGHRAESGWSYLATIGDDGYVLTSDPGKGTVEISHPATRRSAEVCGSMIDALEAARPSRTVTADGFDLGWVGWLGYETGAVALDVPRAGSSGPDSVMIFVDRMIAFDHARRIVEVRTFAGERGAEWSRKVSRRLTPGLVEPVPVPIAAPVASARLRHSPAEYVAMIARCRQEIADGEAYQLCLTNQITVDVAVDVLELYCRLRRLNPTSHGGLIVAGPQVLASTSPELFLRISPEGELVTRPIKGTRPRSTNPVEDAAMRRELLGSAKERAENLMIVDLMRNDFLKVASVGSVRVPELFRVEEYRNLFQLVSTVTGTLAPGRSALDAVRSAFPAGSMTGAPKLRAMGILAGLEDGPRGAYAGAFGYLGAGGAVELSMTIRTVLIDRDAGTATIGTGGGITAGSDPQAELDEMLLKAAPLLTALGAVLVDDD